MTYIASGFATVAPRAVCHDAARAATKPFAFKRETGYAPETRPGGPQHDYLFKPIRPEELARAVERYVGPEQGR